MLNFTDNKLSNEDDYNPGRLGSDSPMGSDTEPMAEIENLEFCLETKIDSDGYVYTFYMTLSSSDED